MRQAHLYRDGEWIAGPIEVAESFFERTHGLLGRDGLPGRSGMAFEFCGSVHTCFMRFAIDVVFLSRDGIVKKVGHGLKPYRVAGSLFAHWTVELPAGLAREIGLEAGQTLEFRTGKEAEPPDPR